MGRCWRTLLAPGTWGPGLALLVSMAAFRSIRALCEVGASPISCSASSTTPITIIPVPEKRVTAPLHDQFTWRAEAQVGYLS
jgi:hypothetical protein